MKIRSRWRKVQTTAAGRMTMIVVGIVLMVVAPVVGALPGPGGVFVFAGGLSLVLKYSGWAKRRYVGFKRRWPRQGRWADWGLRRASARRRAVIDKAKSLPDSRARVD